MIKQIVLDTLREISKDKNSKFPVEDEKTLREALNLNNFNFVDAIGRLLSCVEALVLEQNNMKMANNAKEEQIQQLKDENEALKKMACEHEKIISTYNGSYLQRTKVKNGIKIAKKDNVTKEAIQQLKGQNLTIEQIAEKLGCSRTTVWRRLKE